MKTLDQLSGMPQMGAAFAGWTKKISLVVIQQHIVNGFNQDYECSITFSGTIQPLTAKQLMLKPEGQRAWSWLQIHSLAGELNLNTEDRIIYNGVRYKVMGIWDYSLNNYIEYHVVRDFQTGAKK